MQPVFPHLELAPEVRSHALSGVLAELCPEHPAVAQWRRERNTFHFWVRGETIDRPLFVKIYRPPLVRNLFTPVMRSRARREFENSREAFARGLPVVPAIAFGERRKHGVVVDQMVAFADLGDVRSLAQILLWGGTTPEYRVEGRDAFARTLGALHDGAYLHLAASPRNLLRVRRDNRVEWLWIDHPSAVVWHEPVRAREGGLADVLSAFESAALVPDEAAARAFLEVYAPGADAFAEEALALRRKGVHASAYCARAKWRAAWRKLTARSAESARPRTTA